MIVPLPAVIALIFCMTFVAVGLVVLILDDRRHERRMRKMLRDGEARGVRREP